MFKCKMAEENQESVSLPSDAPTNISVSLPSSASYQQQVLSASIEEDGLQSPPAESLGSSDAESLVEESQDPAKEEVTRKCCRVDCARMFMEEPLQKHLTELAATVCAFSKKDKDAWIYNLYVSHILIYLSHACVLLIFY